MNSLKINGVPTPVFHANDDLISFILKATSNLDLEGSILAITSKIVSLAENRLVNSKELDKEALVKKEADTYLGKIGHGCHLTIKEGILIASAGIDESNSETNDFILYPKRPYESAKQIWNKIKAARNLDQLGILITDSHTTPLRRGVTGIALAHWGFRGVKSQIGEKDLFGRELLMTQINVADALACATTLQMGEGAECRPLATVRCAELIFSEEDVSKELQIPFKDDLYAPLLNCSLSVDLQT